METLIDRRQQDRRCATPFVSAYQLGRHGRRSEARRSDSDGPVYFDRYDPVLALVALAIVFMSAMGAAFTLRLLDAGAVELNSLMAILIEQDVRKFVGFKLALTSLAVLLLVIHHDARIGNWMRVRHIHYMTLAAYVALIVYELMLLRVALL